MHKGSTCKFAAALALLSALAATAARAQDQREQAVQAAVADGMTTAVGVAATAGAINPVGALLTTAGKAITFHRASTLPEAEQPAAYAAASAMWIGSAVSNVCITAVVLTGGGFAPACLALGAAWGFKTWDDSEAERRYWERCAILRQFALRQAIPCAYVPPGQRAALQQAAAKDGPAKHGAVKRRLVRQSAGKGVATKEVATKEGAVSAGAVKTVAATQGTPRRGAPKRTGRQRVLAAQAAAPAPASAPAPAPLFATPHELEAP